MKIKKIKINQISDFNKKIIKDLKEIINEEDLIKKFNYIMNIYGEIKYEYKTEVYKNGNKYIGEFKNKKRNGKGIMYYNDDEENRKLLDGEWKDGMIEGQCTLYWNNGDRYKGDFKNNKKEGNGIFYYSNGCRYEGEFKNDKKDGKGKFYWKNGDRFEGDWKNDKSYGNGIIYYHNGNKCEGSLK